MSAKERAVLDLGPLKSPPLDLWLIEAPSAGSGPARVTAIVPQSGRAVATMLGLVKQFM